MSDWIDVDVAGINPEVRQKINGVDVKVSFSPYDVPRRYCSYKEAGSNDFVIEFAYLTSEDTKPEKFPEGCPVKMEVGINSRRIYKIRLDAKIMARASIVTIDPKPRDKVVNAINHLKQSMPERFKARYELPARIVNKHSESIFSELVH